MVDVRGIEALKNVGIDKDLISKANRASVKINPPKVDPVTGAPEKTYSGTPVAASSSVSASADVDLQLKRLKDELTTTFTNQLQDLAKQFKAYADANDEKVRALEQKIRAASFQEHAPRVVSAPAAAPAAAPSASAGEEHSAVDTKVRVGAGDHAQEIDMGSVSIGKMFNFSNTKGQRNPDPRSNR